MCACVHVTVLKITPDLKLYPQQFSLVQFSRSVMSNSLWPHELQHARPPCPSSTPGVYSNSCPSSRWCHPTISSSVVHFSSCPQSLSASGSFLMSQMRWPKYWSFTFSISPSNEHPVLIFRMDWLDFLAVRETLKSLLQHHSSKAKSKYKLIVFFLKLLLFHQYRLIFPQFFLPCVLFIRAIPFFFLV